MHIVSLSASPNVDKATRSIQAVGCNGVSNCNDYWFKFTVPLDAISGIRIKAMMNIGSLYHK